MCEIIYYVCEILSQTYHFICAEFFAKLMCIAIKGIT